MKEQLLDFILSNIQDIGLLTDNFNFPHERGVFLLKHENVITYVGVGTEKGKGIFKRGRDFTRESNSARDYSAGRIIFDNKNDVNVLFITTENIDEPKQMAREVCKYIKNEIRPVWNKEITIGVKTGGVWEVSGAGGEG